MPEVVDAVRYLAPSDTASYTNGVIPASQRRLVSVVMSGLYDGHCLDV